MSQFEWPQLEHFNFALDHFDALAVDPAFTDALALYIVNEDGSELKRSFAELSKRSAQLANHLHSLGVLRGERVLVMLGNKLKLREIIGAGEPLNPEIIDCVRNVWGLTLRDGYGQTETTAQIGNAPGQQIKAGSMGRPLPGYRIELLDADGNIADEGEVCIDLRYRPVGLMSGYEDSTERTAEAMRDGFYRTGDVAARDADGYITFVGRADDVFKASDYRVSPFELESALIEHPAVVEVAVVPSPDPLRLAVPKAYITLAPDIHPSEDIAKEIFTVSRQRLAPYLRVRRIESEFREEDFPNLKNGETVKSE